MNQEQDKLILFDPVVIDGITVKDFISICRVCLKKINNLVSIAEYEIIKMITSCTSAQISLDDGLPNHLCENCLNALQNAFNFKQLSEISDRNLRKILHGENLNRNFIFKPDPDKIDDVEMGNYDRNIGETIQIKSEFGNEIKIKNEPDNESTPTPLDDIEKYVEKSPSKTKRKRINNEKSRTCHICNKVVGRPSKLASHMASHSNERPHQCSECGKTFKLIDALQTHRKLSHTNKSRFDCDKCDKKFWFLNTLKRHIRRAHDKLDSNNLCDICGKNFSAPEGLKRHSIIHRPERPYQCTECNKSYNLKATLNWHKRAIHLKTKNIYEKVSCKICDRQVTKAHLRMHMKIHENNRNFIECDHCTKKFLYKITLLRHIRHEHEHVPRIRKYLCNICGLAVNSEPTLKEHLLTHSDNKAYECDKCNMKYKSRSGLKRHVQTAHLHLKPFACSICSRNFASKVILANHVRTHTGERPFQCSICEKSFAQKVTLRTHIKLIHKNNK